jgi:hypothetical protein
MKVIAWVGAYMSGFKPEPFTKEHKAAMVEVIRRRHYNFTHADHSYMDYSAPLFDSGKICILTKQQFDDVMDTVYANIPRGARLLPEDAIKREPIDGALYEKPEYEPKEGADNV